MKSSVSLFSAAALLLLSGSAFADTAIRITGSTAFRAATMTAIKNVYSTGLTGYAYNGTSFTGASIAIFKGTISGISGTTTVKCVWSGAVAGVRDVSNSNTLRWLKDTTPIAAGNGQTGAALDNAATDDLSPPDIAMTDNTQDSTIYNDTPLAFAKVGIIPFAFVSSASAAAVNGGAGITGITTQQAQALFTTGFLSASVFTNNPADKASASGGTLVFAFGRDPFSGTRLVSFAESGVGISTVVNQYTRTATSGTSPNQTITQIGLTPADTVSDPLFPVVAGNNGEASGGTLANNLRYLSGSVANTNSSVPTRNAVFISYLGEGDANTAVNGGSSATVNGTGNVGCKFLNFNGVGAFGGTVVSFSNASVTSGSNVVSLPTATTQQLDSLQVGQLVRCATGQIPADSTITAIDSANKTVTVSSNATGASSAASFATSIIKPANIWNGTYTFWNYGYVVYNSDTAAPEVTTFYNALKTQISNVDYFVSGISASGTALKVARGSDGGVVKPIVGF